MASLPVRGIFSSSHKLGKYFFVLNQNRKFNVFLRTDVISSQSLLQPVDVQQTSDCKVCCFDGQITVYLWIKKSFKTPLGWASFMFFCFLKKNRLEFMSRLTAFVAANCTMLIFRWLLTNPLSGLWCNLFWPRVFLDVTLLKSDRVQNECVLKKCVPCDSATAILQSQTSSHRSILMWAQEGWLFDSCDTRIRFCKGSIARLINTVYDLAWL